MTQTIKTTRPQKFKELYVNSRSGVCVCEFSSTLPSVSRRQRQVNGRNFQSRTSSMPLEDKTKSARPAVIVELVDVTLFGINPQHIYTDSQ